MSAEARRYKYREKIRYDRQQTILTGSGIASNPRIYAVTETPLLPVEKKVTCPFCLGLEQFRLFLVSTHKGISRGTAKCPICGLSFRLKTLVEMAKWTAKEYAEWVHPYSRMGFWQKIKFDTWKKRLYLMGWTQEFWLRYKELKGEDTSESFQEYLARTQRENALEKGWINPQEAEALESHM